MATHCHPDHLGQAARLRARGGARVWLHALDAPLVHPAHPTGDADLAALVVWLARHGFPPDEAEEARDAVDAGQGDTYLLEPDRLLEGGETFDVGPYRFEVVWTPGHTPGHVCLYESTRRLRPDRRPPLREGRPERAADVLLADRHDGPVRRVAGAHRRAASRAGAAGPRRAVRAGRASAPARSSATSSTAASASAP